MAKTTNEIPQDRLEAFDRLIDTRPDIERKGKSNPYTSLNGHMFTHLGKTGSMGLRLPADEREAFLEKYNTKLYVSYGATMKEYVTVPDELLLNTQELEPYLDISYEYIKSLKPKPTKKKS
jgi:hypothetical protein